jgi:hypothetical protein
MERISYIEHRGVPGLAKTIDNVLYVFLYRKYAG